MAEGQSHVFCRVCHEDDHPSSFVVPCSCSGSMQYAHQQCIQDWINEKGDKVCEVCCCPYSGTYDDPPPHKKRRQDMMPHILDLDALREYGEDEEEHQQKCQLWGMSCVFIFGLALLVMQIIPQSTAGHNHALTDSNPGMGASDQVGSPTSDLESGAGILQLVFNALSAALTLIVLNICRFIVCLVPCGGLLHLLPPLSSFVRRLLRSHGLLMYRQGVDRGEAALQLPNTITWHTDTSARLLY